MVLEGCLNDNVNNYTIANYGKQCYLYIWTNLRI